MLADGDGDGIGRWRGRARAGRRRRRGSVRVRGRRRPGLGARVERWRRSCVAVAAAAMKLCDLVKEASSLLLPYSCDLILLHRTTKWATKLSPILSFHTLNNSKKNRRAKRAGPSRAWLGPSSPRSKKVSPARSICFTGRAELGPSLSQLGPSPKTRAGRPGLFATSFGCP